MSLDLGVYRGRSQETFLAVNVAGGNDVNLSAAQAHNKILKFTGTLTGNIIVRIPVFSEGLTWLLHNATSGAFSLTVRTQTGNGVTITQGQVIEVYSDGTDLRTAESSGAATALDVDAVGNSVPIIAIEHSYSDDDFPVPTGNHPDYSALILTHTNLAETANISSLFDLIWTGLRSHVQWGSDTINARGTGHAATCTVDCQGSAGANNELAAYMGWMRANAASGTPADGVASHWFCDFSLHGNIGAQSALLNGITMLVNSHHADQPSRGPAAAAWFVTKAGQGGGNEDGHSTAETFPLDVLVGINGYAGDVAQTTPRPGADIGLGIGEWGSGWNIASDEGKSWFTYGASIRGGEAAALRISDPHYNAADAPVGAAILMATADALKSWNWIFDMGSANAPLEGAFRLHDANSTTANRIQWGSSAHAPALYRPADGSLTFQLPDASAGAKVRIDRRALSDPAFHVGGSDVGNTSLSMMLENAGGKVSLVVVGGANNFWTGSAVGDVGVRWDADQVLGIVGGGDLIGSISGAGAWMIAPAAGSVGFFASAGTTKQTVTGATGGNAALASLLSALAAYGLITDSTS